MNVKKLYYSISEVSKATNLKQYVLRYWETEFSQLSPKKNQAGNRKYRETDIKLIYLIKELLYDKKYTINGAKQYLNNKNNSSISSNTTLSEKLVEYKTDINEILNLIQKLK
tara:strand:+ start:913 stop:1248 length:336 start_codon:yes stop_codon:yes gene_type:complete